MTMKSLSPSIAEAAVDEPAARGEVRRQLAAIAPDLAARPRIDRPRDVLRSGHVEHVVADERRRLEVAQRARSGTSTAAARRFTFSGCDLR